MTAKQAIVLSAAVLILTAVPVILISKNSGKRSGEVTFMLEPERQEPVAAPASTPARTVPAIAPRKIDWNVFFRKFDRATGERENELVAEMRSLLENMSNEELIAAMDEIAAVDARSFLQMYLTTLPSDILSSCDPLLVLDRMTDKQDPDLVMVHRKSYQNFLKKDLKLAEQWLDRRIADGFEFYVRPDNGGCYGRNVFDGELVDSLRQQDPKLAIKRVMADPESQRAALLVSSHNLSYVSALSEALDHQDATGEGDLVEVMVRSEEMHRLAFGKDPEEFGKAREAFDRITEESLRVEAHSRLQAVSELEIRSVPLDLIAK